MSKTAEEIEKMAMDKLRDKWSHLYQFGYPQKPFPTNYENELNCVKLGLYEGMNLLQKELDEKVFSLVSEVTTLNEEIDALKGVQCNPVNKNRVVIRIDNERCLVVDRIRLPKFFIKGIEFTEYDMRKLQMEVAQGNISHDLLNSIDITDEAGVRFVFREDGALVNSPKGYDIISRMVLEIFRTRKNK